MRRFSHSSSGSSAVRVVLVGRDRRFLHVAHEFLARSGYSVTVADRPCELLDLLERVGATVVVVDGSDYLATAVRSMTSIEGLREPVGIVTVAEARELSPLTESGVLPKWGSFTRLIREIERVHADRPAHAQPAFAHFAHA